MREDRTVNGNVNNVNKKPEDGKAAGKYRMLPLFGKEAFAYRVPEGKSGDTAYTDERILECVGLFLRETEGKDAVLPRLTVVRDPFGKPHIRTLSEVPGRREGKEAAEAEKIYVSVTHTDGLALVAVSLFSIGIDAEREEKTVRYPEALARRYFTEEDLRALENESFANGAFLTMWVKKEALSKLIGRGIPCMKEKSVFDPELVFEKLAIPGYTVFAVRTK